MRYRQLRRRDTGQWLNVLFTVDGDSFSVSKKSHLRDTAKGFGIPESELEVVDNVVDQRTGALLEPPTAPLPMPTESGQRRTRIAELRAISRSNWTTAQMRELIDLMAGEMSR